MGKNVEPGRVGEWMQVRSGGKFFPLDPRPDEIHIDDIANGLALTCRYGGQGFIDKFYSVAEHSLLMAEYALRNPPKGWMDHSEKINFALAVLMHDAAEAYTGDLVKAIKEAVHFPYKHVENKIQSAILNKYSLFDSSTRWAREIKKLDNRIVANEKAALFDTTLPWCTDSLIPLEGTMIECMNPLTAKNRWLQFFFRLMDY